MDCDFGRRVIPRCSLASSDGTSHVKGVIGKSFELRTHIRRYSIRCGEYHITASFRLSITSCNTNTPLDQKDRSKVASRSPLQTLLSKSYRLPSKKLARHHITNMSSTNTSHTSTAAAHTSTSSTPTYMAPPSYTPSVASSTKSTSSTVKKHLASVFNRKRK